MTKSITKAEVFGLARPSIDAHTLGIAAAAQLLEDCGYRAVVADEEVCRAMSDPRSPRNIAIIERWIRENGVSALGFSYRLDPAQGAEAAERLNYRLAEKNLFAEQGGPLKALFFAGLPETCKRVSARIPRVAGTFCGDETPAETLQKLGIASAEIPRSLAEGMSYDEDLLAFGGDVMRKGDYLSLQPEDRSGYRGFGSRADTLVARINHCREKKILPLFRAHVGPYLPDRNEAIKLFLDWAGRLADSGWLDILSIGSSQLSQSHFGEDWNDMPNGGGVPLNSPQEFGAVWEASRPMLIRAYAGTRNIPALARMYEETINIAWHALSLWWFCRIDGRGPYEVRENLEQHVETIRYIAESGKPLETNVPHHFAFRGADDATYVVSGYISAKLTKSLGIRHFVLQNMLNTPKYTWGVQDLAKSRAMLRLVRELEGPEFNVMLQPRGGLDYFSHDLDKAKAQLAAVTALMDDIEPHNADSPQIIHVVSYSEASHLADPDVVDESVRITRHALAEYRALRQRGEIEDMSRNEEVKTREAELISEAREVIRAIESAIPDPYSAAGFYEILKAGFLPVPFLWACRDEFPKAVNQRVRLVRGSVKAVDEQGVPAPAAERMKHVLAEME